ncbi:MAG: ECF transporter S component [Promethearchaeota archaeon]
MVELEEKLPNEEQTIMTKRSRITLEITGAALFSALSIVVGTFLTPTLTNLLRIPGWFIAIIDLISLIWVVCFLLFGPRAGLVCCIVGTFGLMPFDPSAPVGPLMKLAATVSLIIVPIIFLKLFRHKEGLRNSQKLKKRSNFVLYGLLGTVLRMIVMLFLNILVFLTVFSLYLDQITLAFLGLPEITGLTAVIIGAPIINAWQSGLDLIIPYIIVFGLQLDQKFEIW